jgi:hypothetical protein
MNDCLGVYQPTIQTIAVLISIVALIIIYRTLKKTDRNIRIASDTLDLIRKDFDRTYRPLKVEEIRYKFASYVSGSELTVIILFFNTSQQDVIVSDLNLNFADEGVRPLTFKLNSIKGIHEENCPGVFKIAHSEKSHAVFQHTVTEPEKELFPKVSLTGSRIVFTDNNSNTYDVVVLLETFKDDTDGNPKVTIS